MNCPHCHKELPQGQKSKRCPFCGHDFTASLEPGPLPPPPHGALVWFVFLCALLSSPLLTLWSSVRNEDATPSIALVGGVLGGIACGLILAGRFGSSVLGFLVLGLFLSIIMIFVCVTLCCFGCAIGGYQAF